jgi:hypothetical protein
MAKRDDPTGKPSPEKARREAQLAAALRANLRRRRAPSGKPAKPADGQE